MAELQDINLVSTNLGETRRLTVAIPKSPISVAELPLVVCADGQYLRNMFPKLARELEAGRCPACVFIGVHSSVTHRVPEYIPGVDTPRFNAHEQFVVSEVLAWAESKLRVTTERSKRAIFGLSNGAIFAISMGLKHSDSFGNVIAFSVPGGAGRYRDLPWGTTPEVAFYLAAGNRELPIKRTTQSIAKQLNKHGVTHVFETRQAGHDFAFWNAELPRAVLWTFRREYDVPS